MNAIIKNMYVKRIFCMYIFVLGFVMFSNIAFADDFVDTQFGFNLQKELDTNLAYLQSQGAIRPYNFAINESEGGVWDYKTKLGWNRTYLCLIDGVFVRMSGQDIGNFHYGYIGSFMFDADTLKNAAGLVQILTNSMRERAIDVSSCNLNSYCDDPADTLAIQKGIDYYKGKSVEAIFGNKANAEIQNVTDTFAGKKIKIKSVETGRYVCGENNSTVHAGNMCGTSYGIYETKRTNDGWIGLKLQSGNWLSVQNADYLRTTGQNLQAWECFRIYKVGNYYYLLSQKNNQFVQVTDEVARPLRAARQIENGLAGATWERFEIEIVG